VINHQHHRDIAGAELLELTDEDLIRDLKITKLGHRKRLKKQLDYLIQHNEFLTEEDDALSSSHSDTQQQQTANSSYQGSIYSTMSQPQAYYNNQQQQQQQHDTRSMTSYQSGSTYRGGNQDELSENGSQSSVNTYQQQNDLLFKCYEMNQRNESVDTLIIKFENTVCVSLEELKREILMRKQQTFQDTQQIHLKYKDDDDDVIVLKRDEDLKICIQQFKSMPVGKYIKIYISSNHSSNNTSKTTTSSPTTNLNQSNSSNSSYSGESEELIQILESMVDAIVIMTATDKSIKYVNKAAESLLLYSRNELIGQNVTKIMPTSYRQNHDQYVDHYVKTGVAKIINKGRLVPVKTKQGKVFDCWLSVNESTWENQRAFTGTLKLIYQAKETQTPNASSSLTRFHFLENMVDAVIIITGDDDIVRYFNKSAEQMFGWNREEIVGQVIGKLIPDETTRMNHNQYVRRYMEKGDAKVVGIGRQVSGMTKQGKIIPVFLSVNETKWNGGLDGRAFIGTLKSLQDENNVTKFMQ